MRDGMRNPNSSNCFCRKAVYKPYVLCSFLPSLGRAATFTHKVWWRGGRNRENLMEKYTHFPDEIYASDEAPMTFGELAGFIILGLAIVVGALAAFGEFVVLRSL